MVEYNICLIYLFEIRYYFNQLFINILTLLIPFPSTVQFFFNSSYVYKFSSVSIIYPIYITFSIKNLSNAIINSPEFINQ